MILVLLYKGQIYHSLGQEECLVHDSMLRTQQSTQMFWYEWTSEMMHFSCPYCNGHLQVAQLHVQLLSLPEVVAEGSPIWVMWRFLSQLDENAEGDFLSLKQ